MNVLCIGLRVVGTEYDGAQAARPTKAAETAARLVGSLALQGKDGRNGLPGEALQKATEAYGRLRKVQKLYFP